MRGILRKAGYLVVASPAKLTVATFVLLMVLLRQAGYGNEDARLATMAALVTDRTFSITDYYQWTEDWAVSPVNNMKYANKAPLPAILGAPIYWFVDLFVMWGKAPSEALRQHERSLHRRLYGYLISLVVQVLPFAWLTLLCAHWLNREGYSPHAVQFAVVGILFGNSASLLMNTYFGHGLAAFFVLAAVLCWLKRYYAASGLLLGGAALSDYGAVLIVAPFVVSIIVRERRRSLRPLLILAAGLALPAAVWAVYHWNVFGHPLHIATKYSNPHSLYAAAHYPAYSLAPSAPNGRVLLALLFGTRRGLLFTQPWILVTVVLSTLLLISRKIRRPDFFPLVVLLVGGLGSLLLSNSAISFWDGGLTAGPRYISSILPLFGLLAAIVYAALSRVWRLLLWLTLAVAVLLFAAAYSTTILAESAPLWLFYWHRLGEAIRMDHIVAVLYAAILSVVAAASVADIFMSRRLGQLDGRNTVN